MQAQAFAAYTKRDLAKAKRLARRTLVKDSFDSATARYYFKKLREIDYAARHAK